MVSVVCIESIIFYLWPNFFYTTEGHIIIPFCAQSPPSQGLSLKRYRWIGPGVPKSFCCTGLRLIKCTLYLYSEGLGGMNATQEWGGRAINLGGLGMISHNKQQC